MSKIDELKLDELQSGVRACGNVRHLTRFSLRWLLAGVALICIVFAVMRALTPTPTPRSIMREARVGLIRLGGDRQPHAVIIVSDQTELTRAAINAIVAFDKERPVRGIVFKRQSIQGMDVELMSKLKHVMVVTVRGAQAVAPDLLVKVSMKDKLSRLVFYDSDLAGLVFPSNLSLAGLCLEDSVISSQQFATFSTYHQLSHFSACGTPPQPSFEWLLGLTELEHVSLVGQDVSGNELRQLCRLPKMKMIHVTDSAMTRELLLERGESKLNLHRIEWRPIKSDL